MRPLLRQKRDAHYYCASPIMQVKEMHVSRGASPIPSPNMKAGTSPFIMNAGMSPILYIERRVLEWRVSISYPPYKSHSQLGQNSGGA
jgi:hypothetical protein